MPYVFLIARRRAFIWPKVDLLSMDRSWERIIGPFLDRPTLRLPTDGDLFSDNNLMSALCARSFACDLLIFVDWCGWNVWLPIYWLLRKGQHYCLSTVKRSLWASIKRAYMEGEEWIQRSVLHSQPAYLAHRSVSVWCYLVQTWMVEVEGCQTCNYLTNNQAAPRM